MEGIYRDVNHAYKALPRRGVETGGILLGEVGGEGISIRDYQPIGCEHRFGPAWHLSEVDLGALEAALESLRRGDLTILGLYRSDTSLAPRTTPEDRRLFNGCFGESAAVFLLIHPAPQRPTTATAFFWKNGDFEPAGTAVGFPFNQEAAPQPARVPTLRSIRARQVRVPAMRPPAAAVAASPSFAPPPPTPPAQTPLVAGAQAAEPAPTVAPGFVIPELPPRPALRRAGDRRPRRAGVWAAALVLAAVVAGAGLISWRWFRPTPPSVPVIDEASRTNTAPAVPSRTPAPSAARPAPDAPAAEPPSVERETSAPARPTTLKAEIRSVLDDWAAAVKTGDPERTAHFYAPRLSSYLGRRNVTNADVRGHIGYLYGRYGRPILVRIDRLSISRSGRDRAAATFRKYWQTSAHFAGQERTHVTFIRSGDEWKIASEQTLRTDFIRRLR